MTTENNNEFTIQDKHYVVEQLHGNVADLQQFGKKKEMWLDGEDEDIRYDIPWHTEVKPEDAVFIIYGYDKNDPDNRTVYYLYNKNKKSIEAYRKYIKPNKGALLAILDFALVIGLGLALSPFLHTILKKNTIWGFVSLFVMIVILYVLVHKVTYKKFFNKQLQEIKRINTAVKNTAEDFMEQTIDSESVKT